MRASLVALVVLVAGVWAAAAFAASPAQIYNDYVRTGHLSCSYSRSDLEALLRSGSINQYGDPLTLANLKLAARQHLSGGCEKRHAQPVASTPTTTTTPTTSTSTKPVQPKPKRQPTQRLQRPLRLAAGGRASASGDNGSFVAGRALIVVLLAVALAFAGWLTKRALTTRD